jgi:hypothetical protein
MYPHAAAFATVQVGADVASLPGGFGGTMPRRASCLLWFWYRCGTVGTSAMVVNR